jgi:hypothetical protein
MKKKDDAQAEALHVRVPAEMKDRLERLAKKAGLKPSALVRIALMEKYPELQTDEGESAKGTVREPSLTDAMRENTHVMTALLTEMRAAKSRPHALAQEELRQARSAANAGGKAK